MEIKIFIKTRSNLAFAEALYNGKTTTVLPGGKISPDFAEHIQGGKKALSFRNNSTYVDKDGIIIQECVFQSPSTAAQFVTGRSTNGYNAWKVERKKSLGKYLSEKGFR